MRERRPALLTSDESSRKYKSFAGLINTKPGVDIGFKGLKIANNVLGDDEKHLFTRPGFSLYLAGTPITAYVLGDNLYIVEGGNLKRVVSPTDVRTLTSGLTGTNYSWDSVNYTAYFVNGVEAGMVFRDTYQPLRINAPTITSVEVVDAGPTLATPFNVGEKYNTVLWRFVATYETEDGRESAPSEVAELSASPLTKIFRITVPPQYARTNIFVTEPDGTVFRQVVYTTDTVATFTPSRATRELTTLGMSPLPDAVEKILYWEGRMWASQYFAAENTSVLWFSRPFAFHLYNMGQDYFVVPGRVSMLLWANEGLLIGTTEAVYSYDGEKLNQLVSYGVPPGSAGTIDSQGIAYFWTVRGFCKAMPFENLTEKNVGMPPGLWANTALMQFDGMEQVVTITQGGGTPFNIRS